MNQLLLPESTLLVRHNNTAKMICDKCGTKFYPVSQDEMELYFSYVYTPADQVKIDEVVSNTFRHPGSGCIIGYDPVSDKPGITKIFTSFRREMSEREFYREVMNTASYYGVTIEEENTENIKKWQEKLAKWREPIPAKRPIEFTPISAELNQKLRDYQQAYLDSWKELLRRNPFI